MDRRSLQTRLDELAKAEAELAEIADAHARLEARISELRGEIASARELAPEPVVDPIVSAIASATSAVPITAAEKVNLFRSLFRGRPDVFARLWINQNRGTKGYAPACTNEWVRGVCEKPRVKCGECPNQAFEAVSDQAVHDHLRGRHVVGVYPLLQDETCWFLAVDFDKAGWKQDVAAFTNTCAGFGLQVAVERSRSGNGAHAWFFFDEPVAATLARKMGCYLLTETMTRRHELPMTSYDRLFPNQDTMPRGGFGNLIALPLQFEAREAGNTVFVDGRGQPHSDQWAFLASHPRLEAARVRELAREAGGNGKILGISRGEPVADDGAAPWFRSPSRNVPTARITEPLPERVSVVVSQQIFVEKHGLPPSLLNQIKRLAAFQNPEFYKKQAMRLSTALTPRIISCAEDLPDHIGLPRGCLDDLRELLCDNRVTLALEDRRHVGDPYEISFCGELNKAQECAVRELLAYDDGVFVAPPASGKTVVGIKLIAERGRNALVLVHRAQLLDQWRARLSTFLDVDPKQIGQIGAGKRRITGKIDVAMIQSLVRRDGVDDVVAGYGHVIVDECHHVPAVSFERVMREVRARFVTGLTATPRRRDGHEPILELQLGPVRASIDPRSDTARHAFDHRVIVCETRFRQGKSEVRIYDYVDREVPMLARMFEKRLKGYRAMGYDAVVPPRQVVRAPQEDPPHGHPRSE